MLGGKGLTGTNILAYWAHLWDTEKWNVVTMTPELRETNKDLIAKLGGGLSVRESDNIRLQHQVRGFVSMSP